MANILTNSEAANVLRCETTDQLMLDLLPAINSYIEGASRKWTDDTTIHPVAKAAARILLALWHENPSMTGQEAENLSGGFKACMAQLEAEARYYYTFEGSSSSGYISLPEAREGDTVSSLTGRVGVTGDQSAKFESVITVSGYIKQTASEDLSSKWYTAKLVPAGEI
jgi:hypothetical protein